MYWINWVMRLPRLGFGKRRWGCVSNILYISCDCSQANTFRPLKSKAFRRSLRELMRVTFVAKSNQNPVAGVGVQRIALDTLRCSLLVMTIAGRKELAVAQTPLRPIVIISAA